MPSKVKMNAIAAGSAGFLRPTFSSMSKAVERNETKANNEEFKSKKEAKKQVSDKDHHGDTLKKDVAIHVPLVSEESPLHSAMVTNTPVSSPGASQNKSTPSNEPTDGLISATLRTPPDPPARIPKVSTDLLMTENELKICDARRVCDELRMQIEDLKSQQKQFVSRISKDFDTFDIAEPQNEQSILSNNIVKECENCDAQGTMKLNTGEDKQMTGSQTMMSKLNSLKKPDEDDSSTLSEDSFTLHGSMTSSDAHIAVKNWIGAKSLPKDIPPTKVIKRLFSEKERYRKKVKHLQAALCKLKKEASSTLSRSPDIAARDIVYFNADLIGEGFLSYVYSGTIYKNQKAAVKKLVRPDMMTTSDRSYLAAEAGLLMSLHHHNIVEVYGVATAPLQPLIITELVEGCSLHLKLHSKDVWPLSPVEYYSIVRDIIIGMAYLHGQKPPVLHLNLRPRNILLERTGRAKVADFGFSKIRLDAGISNHANLSYLAPELLQFPVNLTTKLDVFSLAMIMWEMASMRLPYEDMSTSEILDHVSAGKRLSVPSELPSGFHAIISRCWDQAPLQRPSFKELIILLETMSLPQDWDEVIKRSGLSRADTTGLTTPREKMNKRMFADSFRHQGAKYNAESKSMADSNIKGERRRLSEEVALEVDMMTMGYKLPKSEYTRIESKKFLEGFLLPPSSLQNNQTSKGTSPTRLTYNRYSIPHKSPLRASRPPSHGLDEVCAGNNAPRKNSVITSEHSAARNLNLLLIGKMHSPQEIATAKDERNKSGSQKSTEANGPGDPRQDSPQPLTDRDMKYVDQDLAVGTPKIINVRNGKPETGTMASPASSLRSQEDLRTAVSIPYLKNLRSGDEANSSEDPSTHRSYFDEKLHSYVSDACHAESKKLC